MHFGTGFTDVQGLEVLEGATMWTTDSNFTTRIIYTAYAVGKATTCSKASEGRSDADYRQ